MFVNGPLSVILALGNVSRALIVCLFVPFVCLYKRSVRAETHLDPDGTRLKQNMWGKVGEWRMMRNGEQFDLFSAHMSKVLPAVIVGRRGYHIDMKYRPYVLCACLLGGISQIW